MQKSLIEAKTQRP